MKRAANIAANETLVLQALNRLGEPAHARRVWLLLINDLAESAVYVVLKRLAGVGALLVREDRGVYKGPRRPLYSLAAKGRKRLNGHAS